LILNAGKDVENRTWPEWYPARAYRGEFLIHAAKGCTRQEYEDACETSRICGFRGEIPDLSTIDRGGLVGIAYAADFATEHPSRWFFGPGAIVLTHVAPIPFHACKGALGFFRP
jgi:hypothetical protein